MSLIKKNKKKNLTEKNKFKKKCLNSNLYVKKFTIK